jgi:hypothetical protein
MMVKLLVAVVFFPTRGKVANGAERELEAKGVFSCLPAV